jgi:hypothetical protein
MFLLGVNGATVYVHRLPPCGWDTQLESQVPERHNQ